MDINLNICDGDVSSRVEGKNTLHFWENHRVSKGVNGWHTYAYITSALGVEQIVLAPEFAEAAVSFEGDFYASGADCRHEGIYEIGGTKIIVLPRNEGSQKIEFFSTDLAVLQKAMKSLRIGELNPRYPLTREQGAPTYADLSDLVSAQRKALECLTDNAVLSTKVLNEAQRLIFKQGDSIKELEALVVQYCR